MKPIDEQLIKRIGELKRIEPDPFLLRSLKIRIMEEVLRVPLPDSNFMARMRFVLAPAVVALVAIVTSAAFASQKSLPDDLLYPVKLASENVILRFTPDPGKQAGLKVNFAEKRLNETLDLQSRGTDGAVIADTLSLYENRLREAAKTLESLEPNPNNIKTLGSIAKTLERNSSLLKSLGAGLAASSSGPVADKLDKAIKVSTDAGAALYGAATSIIDERLSKEPFDFEAFSNDIVATFALRLENIRSRFQSWDGASRIEIQNKIEAASSSLASLEERLRARDVVPARNIIEEINKLSEALNQIEGLL